MRRPAALAGGREGVGAEADAAGLEEAHDADQLAQLAAAPRRRCRRPRPARRRPGTGAPRRRGPCPRCASPRSAPRSCRRGPSARRAAAAGAAAASAGRRAGAIRTSASSASRASASSTARASSSRSRSRENSVQPSQSEAMKTVSICAARSPGSAGDRLAARLQVRGGDAGGGDRVAGRLEGGQRAQLVLALAHEARRQRHVAVEEGVVAGSRVDVEGDLVAAGDQGAEAYRRLGGQPLQRLVEQGSRTAPASPRGWRSCACTTPCKSN